MITSTASPLLPGEAYRIWASTYDGENVVSALDELAVAQLTPPLSGRDLLDAGCGTARRLRFDPGAAPRRAVGVDLVFEMLLRSRNDPRRGRLVAAGDLRMLPIGTATFDIAWCRLAAGHLEHIDSFYSELSRSVRRGGLVIVTDFHPAAAQNGHVRSFRDAGGTSHVVAHFVHEVEEHDHAARRVGLTLDTRLDLSIGPPVKHFYDEAGVSSRYERDVGLPMVLALRYRR